MSAQAAIERFREQLGHYMAVTRRGGQTSTLFDLPLRSMLGGICFYENLPELLAELDEPPAAIGQRMRRLASRPYAMHLNSMIFGFLTGLEEQRGSGRAAPDDEDARVERTVAFWAAAFEAYREEGTDFSGGRQRVLDEELLRGPLDALASGRPGRHALARELALLQSLNFLLHGESRDGLFDHGPYDERAESCVVVKELTDLHGGLYAWAGPSGAAGLPFDRAVAVRRIGLPASTLRFDMFGTMAAVGVRELSKEITHELILAERPDGELVPIEEVISADELRGQIRAVNRKLLGIFAAMPADDRITYGAPMYANMLVGFGWIGSDSPAEWESRVLARFKQSGARALERMRSTTAAVEAWARMGAERA